MTENRLVDFVKRELVFFESRLHRLKKGDIRVGVSDGVNWTETTGDEIKLAESKIAELKELLERESA